MSGPIFTSTDTDPDSHPALAALTAREREVFFHLLKGLEQGKPIKQIAAELEIDQRTASAHKTSIMTKLGVASIFGLLLFALLNGFIDSHKHLRDTSK